MRESKEFIVRDGITYVNKENLITYSIVDSKGNFIKLEREKDFTQGRVTLLKFKRKAKKSNQTESTLFQTSRDNIGDEYISNAILLMRLQDGIDFSDFIAPFTYVEYKF